MRLREALAGLRLVNPSDGVHPYDVGPADESADRRLHIRRIARILARPRDWYSLTTDERAKYVMLAARSLYAVEEAAREERAEQLLDPLARRRRRRSA